MKKIFSFIAFVLIIALLSGCSNKPSLKLIKSSVTIANDKNISGSIGITEGKKKGQYLVPTVLYYQFTIQNTGKKKIGSIRKKGIELKIEPHDKLKSALEEIIGFNIFNPDSYTNTGLGYGETSKGTMLKAGEKGYFTLTYDLGVSEENPNTTVITPSDELLEKLQRKALDASLIITCDGKEIASFNLSKE